MARVLIVDDERDYREELSLLLKREGYEVRTAASGREAIDRGIPFRPDVVICDWMLRNHIHGLHVADVLQRVDARTRTILVTGFSSRDLQREASSMQVFRYLEKPFELSALELALREALRATETREQDLPVPFVEVHGTQRVRRLNSAARTLFRLDGAEAIDYTLSDLFHHESIREMDGARRRWRPVRLASGREGWTACVRRFGDSGTRVIVLAPLDRPELRDHPAVMLMLGHPRRRRGRWPFDCHVLIIDPNEQARRRMTAELNRAGCLVHSVSSCEEAALLYARDYDTQIVVVHEESLGDALGDCVKRLQAMRPDVVFVGVARADRRSEFAGVGVESFLPDPWTVEQLTETARERLEG